MQSLRTISSNGYLVLAVLAAGFSAGAVRGQDSTGRPSG